MRIREALIVAAMIAPIGIPSTVTAQSKEPGVVSSQELLTKLSPPKTRGLVTRGLAVKPDPDAPPPASQLASLPQVTIRIQFEFNSAELTPSAKAQLDELGAALRDSAASNWQFLIAGHTDGVGTETYNQMLSQQRAEASRSYVIKKFNLPENQIWAVGYGRSQLLDAQNPENPLNRRVQIVNVGERPKP